MEVRARRCRGRYLVVSCCVPVCNRLSAYFGKEQEAGREWGAETQRWHVETGAQDRGQRDLLLTRDSSWICNFLLQAMGTECAQSDRGCAINAAESPEWKRHCVLK